MGWEGSQHEAGTGEAASDMAGSGGHIYRRVPLLSQRGGDGCGQTAFKLGAGAAASSRAGAGTDPVAKGRREGRARRAFFFSPQTHFPRSNSLCWSKGPTVPVQLGDVLSTTAARTCISRIRKQPLCPGRGIAQQRGCSSPGTSY